MVSLGFGFGVYFLVLGVRRTAPFFLFGCRYSSIRSMKGLGCFMAFGVLGSWFLVLGFWFLVFGFPAARYGISLCSIWFLAS